MSEVTPNCLDAETLAAWMDDGLPPAALDAARAHVAGCGRCQALVATMVRLDPPAAAAVAPAPSRWWMTWLLPAAGAAAAVTIWFAVTRPDALAPALKEESKQAAAPATITPVPPPAEPAAKTVADDALKRDASALAKERRQNTEAKNELSARSREDKDAKKKADTAPSAIAAAPPVAAEANAAAARQEKVSQPAAQMFDQRAIVGPVDVRSPDPAVRWRVMNGRIEQSTDAGTTWTTQHTLAAGATIVAGSSPSRDVCWLVGAGGLVLLAPDGRTWARLPFPETVPLASVTATDGVSTSVRTPDGREFSTKDGGKTWIRRPVQDF